MEPYTNEGISRIEEGVGKVGQPRHYEVMGIVVHSGQASAGHYYSFIKEKRFVCVCLENIMACVCQCTRVLPSGLTCVPPPFRRGR